MTTVPKHPDLVPPLIIAGMPRSGTSATARLLALSGLDVGGELNPPRDDNPLGYYEDVSFYELDREMIAAALPHAEHRRPNWMYASEVVFAHLEAFRDRACTLLAERGSRGRAWGFKDPRATMLLPFWDKVAPDARYLFVYRAPWEVVDSLMRLEGRPLAGRAKDAIEAWAVYNQTLLKFAEQHRDRVAIVHVRAVADAPNAVIGRVNDMLADLGLAGLDSAHTGAHARALLGAVPEEDSRTELITGLFPHVSALYKRLELSADLSSATAHEREADLPMTIAAGKAALPLQVVFVGGVASADEAITTISVDPLDPSSAANQGVLAAGEGLVAVVFRASVKPRALEIAAKTLNSTPTVGAVLLGAGMPEREPGVELVERSLLLRADLDVRGIVIRFNLWERCGGFDVSLPDAGLDAWAMGIAVAAGGAEVAHIPSALLGREQHVDVAARLLARRHVAERYASFYARELPVVADALAAGGRDLQVELGAQNDRFRQLEQRVSDIEEKVAHMRRVENGRALPIACIEKRDTKLGALARLLRRGLRA